MWQFLMPGAIGWTLRTGGHLLWDTITGADPQPLRVRDFVAEHATRGDPASVLQAMDRFAREVRFLMNIGPDKGPLVQELVAKLPDGARVLELGAFCGYSSILFATAFGPASRITSVEKSEASVEGSRANVEFAGLSDRVEIHHGSSTDRIAKLEGAFDLVFLDHWKDLYETDLKLLEQHALLRPGTIVVADNVGELFGVQSYLNYVRGCGRYDSENRPATVEYSSMPDAIEISVFRG